ncbi:MAG: bifunctional diaminohydroxyphosphoribosylaminopyrimidine deaminase/5-amino-6-(5-phosphoribosylamino)uracil reductase RibD [Nitrospirae bacterium]|nr:bifunctional diaminohydroxyphosphoribosylaminopyrimidine deaminase/5-amino-6-(5-phosphoribosylamino)uracil reductase RibD [Nitrospirota bacterium]
MTDEACIRRTLTLARRAEGMTSPNPMVGAVLVKHGKIIAEGYHRKAGTPHAEVIAIEKAGLDASGATLYVSLEPCCHKDKRTPPCTETIIAAGINKVVIAMQDPNPKVSGKGIEELRKAGIEVISGILEDKARQLNEFYIKHITTHQPFVVLKVAMTLDGKIATPVGESKWITGEKARKEVHRLRGKVDALLTAIGTIRADDPLLTCRTGRLKNPIRIILDPDLDIREDANVLTCPPGTIVVTNNGSSRKKRERLQGKGVSLIEHTGNRIDLQWLMNRLGAEGIISVLIEGGSSLASSCLEAGIVDKVIFYIAPKIIGGEKSFPAVGGKAFRSLSQAHMLRRTECRRIGDDFVIEGYLDR